MRPYPMELRVRILAAIDAGEGTSEVARTFTVSPAWVRRLAQRRRQTGEVRPRVAADTRTPKLRDHLPRIRELLAATPDLTLTELRAELPVVVALSTLWAAVRSLGLTFKKTDPGGRAGPTGRASGPRRLAAGGRPGPRPGPGGVRG
jgi:transposase